MDDSFKLVRKHCLKNCEHMLDTGAGIYRGFLYRQITKNLILYLGDDMRNRHSVNTSNSYTLLMSGVLPEWNAYPKRSDSYICSTSLFDARQYGYPYFMIPFDDTTIGLAPASDIWRSFSMDRMEIFNNQFNNMMGCLVPSYEEDADMSPTQLKFLIKAATIVMKKHSMPRIAYDFGGLHNRLTMCIKTQYGGDILAALNDLLSPTKNGFKIGLLPDLNFEGKQPKEIWFSGKCFALPLTGKLINTGDVIGYIDKFLEKIVAAG